MLLSTDTDASVFHMRLAKHNACRLAVGVPSHTWENDEFLESKFRILEGRYIEDLRQSISSISQGHEESPSHFVDWFKSLADWGPGQHHPLFDWLEHNANLEEMKWFLTQEVAGEAGFDDLVAYSQVKLPVQAKLECARNYWDEMGRGKRGAMHGPLLERMVEGLNLKPSIDATVWESLALGNTMVAMATTRRYTYQSLGALGVIELTAPGRAVKVAAGMKRLGIDQKLRAYFDLHAVLDVAHSESWIREIIQPLVVENPGCARYLAEGALMRLQCGKQCFDRYSRELGVDLIPIEFALPDNSYAERTYRVQ
ncbi:MAG: iron-containing redox enzyme family protein [Moraxellaceae bacterium]|nr:MAG: iron-containing redox enzyme family protein [Moraxellaceae bacterium]